MTIDDDRVQRRGPTAAGSGPVIYWMSRDARVTDNWALQHAYEEALTRQSPLAVCFTLIDGYLDAPWRHYSFMLAGLEEAAAMLAQRGIPFYLLRTQSPADAVLALVRRVGAAMVVCDFNPLGVNRSWQRGLTESGAVGIHRVDAHNIVPCWVTSPRQEYAARTIRPKIHRLLDRFLVEPPAAPPNSPAPSPEPAPEIDWSDVSRTLLCDRSVGALESATAGEKAALSLLDEFMAERLTGYATRRNDPNSDGQSGLSPYLHFGHIAAQRVAYEVRRSDAPDEDVKAFLEELIVRKELSDNFCYYNDAYDSVDGFPEWARRTLDEHRRDPRVPSYDEDSLERATTHDELWNAAQRQMVRSGTMHGYLRMYWAKKILEWTPTPEEAMRIGISLNDRYSLDGRDPNGYVGVAWSIGGVHDRAWAERPIFGKIRYMSQAGCRRKFDVDAYVARWFGNADGAPSAVGYR